MRNYNHQAKFRLREIMHLNLIFKEISLARKVAQLICKWHLNLMIIQHQTPILANLADLHPQLPGKLIKICQFVSLVNQIPTIKQPTTHLIRIYLMWMRNFLNIKCSKTCLLKTLSLCNQTLLILKCELTSICNRLPQKNLRK